MEDVEGRKYGFLRLAKKSLAIITASLSALLNNQTKARPTSLDLGDSSKKLNYEYFQKRFLKSRLVLKISSNDPNAYLIAQHRSHSSHSSHASHSSYTPPPGHSSHTSHASHYSSSTTPAPPPSVYTPPSPSSVESKVPSYHKIGSRVMYNGCEGTDVQEVQRMLLLLGYVVESDGIFERKTEEAINKFQKENGLHPDGKVGYKTLTTLKGKTSGN